MTSQLPAGSPDERSAYTAGLRRLADILDGHPEAKLPYDGRKPSALLFQPDTAAELDALKAALGCEWTTRDFRTPEGEDFHRLFGDVAGLRIELLIRVGDLAGTGPKS